MFANIRDVLHAIKLANVHIHRNFSFYVFPLSFFVFLVSALFFFSSVLWIIELSRAFRSLYNVYFLNYQQWKLDYELFHLFVLLFVLLVKFSCTASKLLICFIKLNAATVFQISVLMYRYRKNGWLVQLNRMFFIFIFNGCFFRSVPKQEKKREKNIIGRLLSKIRECKNKIQTSSHLHCSCKRYLQFYLFSLPMGKHSTQKDIDSTQHIVCHFI